MKRRRVLAAAALSISAAGCLTDTIDGQGDTDSPVPSPTGSEQPRNGTAETETPSPEGAVPGCWPNMCEGTQVVEVVVSTGFSGTAILDAGCRGETRSLRSGDSVQIDRDEDGERCPITLSIDGETVYEDDIAGYERVTVTVRSNGDIDTERIVY